jgi:hypothetical protein
LRILDCLIGHSGSLLPEQGVGQGFWCPGQVEIRKDYLLLEIAVFCCQWLLHLQDQVGIPRLLHCNNVRSGLAVLRIREA